MRVDFNKEAMEHKIKLNLDKDWTIKGMFLSLLRERELVLKEQQKLEERDTELADQIEYLKENYSGPIGL